MYFGNQGRSYCPVFVTSLDAKIWQKTFGVKKCSNLLQYLNMIFERYQQKIMQKAYKIDIRQKRGSM